MPLHATLPDLSLPGNLFALHFAVHPREVIMVIYETVRVKWWLFINGIEDIVSGRLLQTLSRTRSSLDVVIVSHCANMTLDRRYFARGGMSPGAGCAEAIGPV